MNLPRIWHQKLVDLAGAVTNKTASAESCCKYRNASLVWICLGNLSLNLGVRGGEEYFISETLHMTQFEIECRTGGQSIVNFWFISCRSPNYFTVSHYSCLCACYKIYKTNKKGPNSYIFSFFLVFNLIFIALGHAQLFYIFLGSPLKHLDAS